MAICGHGEGTIGRLKNGTYQGKLSLKGPSGSRMTLTEYLVAWLNALDVRPNTFKLRRHLVPETYRSAHRGAADQRAHL